MGACEAEGGLVFAFVGGSEVIAERHPGGVADQDQAHPQTHSDFEAQ